MATTQNRPYLAGNEIKLEPGVAQVFALKFVTGKNLGDSQFPPYMPRVLFTAIDDRRLYLDAEDGSNFEIRLRELGVRPADFIRAIRIRKGGGIAVERVGDPDTQPDTHPDMRHPAVRMPAQTAPPSREEARAAVPTREEALLEKSVEMARDRGAAAFQRTPSRICPDPAPAPAVPTTNNGDHSVRAHQLKGSFLAAIDAIAEAQKYADAQGLKVTFTSDDVRAAAISVFIQAEKAACGARY
jgi:hypothetical protein